MQIDSAYLAWLAGLVVAVFPGLWQLQTVRPAWLAGIPMAAIGEIEVINVRVVVVLAVVVIGVVVLSVVTVTDVVVAVGAIEVLEVATAVICVAVLEVRLTIVFVNVFAVVAWSPAPQLFNASAVIDRNKITEAIRNIRPLIHSLFCIFKLCTLELINLPILFWLLTACFFPHLILNNLNSC